MKFGSLVCGQYDSDTEILEQGFSLVGGETADDLNCPHCGVEIKDKDDTTTVGDAILCVNCGGAILDNLIETPQMEEESDFSINRREFSAAWDTMLDYDSMDYDTD